MLSKIFSRTLKVLAPAFVLFGSVTFAEEATVASNADSIALVQQHLDLVWVLFASVLVFLMQPGFALVEAGLTRAKNVVNIMFKNLMDFSIGTIVYWMVGYGIMFGASLFGFIGGGFLFGGGATLESPGLSAVRPAESSPPLR